MRDMPRSTISGYRGSPSKGNSGSLRLSASYVQYRMRVSASGPPSGRPVRPGREGLEEGSPFRVPGEGLALLSRPGKPDRVRPDEERGVPGDGALAVREGHLDVALEPDREVRPEPRRDPPSRTAPAAFTKTGAAIRSDPPSRRETRAPPTRPPARQHLFHPARDEERAVPARFLEEVHTELLRAEPPAAPGMKHRDDVLGKPGEVPANERPVDDEVGPGRRVRVAVRPVGDVGPSRRARRGAGGPPAPSDSASRPAASNAATRSGLRSRRGSPGG